MNFENAHDVSATYNSYSNNSGNSYTYTYVTNNITHSFNSTHSHNGGARGCGLLLPLLLVVLPVIVSLVFCNVLAGWLA